MCCCLGEWVVFCVYLFFFNFFITLLYYFYITIVINPLDLFNSDAMVLIFVYIDILYLFYLII